jgi:hypothetical protein
MPRKLRYLAEHADQTNYTNWDMDSDGVKFNIGRLRSLVERAGDVSEDMGLLSKPYLPPT